MRRLIIALSLFVSSCATEAQYRANVEAMIGQPESMLVSLHGVPNATHRTDDDNVKFVVYKRGSVDTMPGYCQMAYGVVFCRPAQSFVYYCETTFRIEGGIVRSWTASGNACRA